MLISITKASNKSLFLTLTLSYLSALCCWLSLLCQCQISNPILPSVIVSIRSATLLISPSSVADCSSVNPINCLSKLYCLPAPVLFSNAFDFFFFFLECSTQYSLFLLNTEYYLISIKTRGFNILFKIIIKYKSFG